MSKVNLDNINIDAALKQQIKDKINELLALMPFAVDLDTEDRKKGTKIGPNRRDFANEMRDVVKDHPEILPGSFNAARFQKAGEQEKPLEDIETWLEEAFAKIDDTHLDVGRIYYTDARKAYQYLQQAEGLDDLKAKMSKYFEKAKKEEEEGSTPT